MSYNGAGTFVINSTGQPVAAGTAITATAFNALTADLATGLSTAMCKDGQSTATANLPMGGFKLTGLANGSAATDSVALGQLQGLTASYLTVSGSTTITATASPTLTAYTAGQAFWFKAAGTCSASPTINIDGLGAKNLSNGASLAAGGLLSGLIYIIVYDGSQFLVANPSGIRTLTVTSSFNSIGSTTIGDAAGDPFTITSSSVAIPNNLGIGGTSGTALFIDNANNRIGVGTSTTNYSLNVASTANTIALVKSNFGNGAIYFGDLAADDSGAITYDHSVDAMILRVNGAESLRVTSAGRVGIGTNAPGQPLTVAGTIESTTGGVKFPDGTTQATASKILQQVSASSSAYASGTTTTPADDTIPQNTEGTEFLTVTITPKSASSNLLVEVNATMSTSSTATVTSALFRDSGANAIAAQGQGANGSFVSVIKVIVAASSTSATTFKLRVGADTASTVGMNGLSGARLYGGAAMSTITVTEILP